MKKLGIVCSLLAATFVIAAAYGGEFKSGLQVGEKAPAFNVVNVTGQGCVVDYAKDSRDKLCYRWKFGANPVVCVFAREINGSLTRLVKRIDKQIAKNTDKKLCSFVVFLTDDSEALTAKVEKLAEKAKIKNVPLTIAESLAGPPAYKISEDAEVTVLLWKGKGPEVRVNHAFKAGELKKEQIAAVIKDIPKILEN